jgi:hypothetical protein
MKIYRYCIITTGNSRYTLHASNLKTAVGKLKKAGYIFPNNAIKSVKRELVYITAGAY